MKQLYSLVGIFLGLALISIMTSNFARATNKFSFNSFNHYSYVNRASLLGTDNIANNKVRDANNPVLKDQQESPSDLTITQAIRKILIEDKSLSVNGKNVAVVTENGRVTLRGIVDSEQEKSKIEAIAKQAEGVKSVKNELQPPKP
jgi:hyperosmotically inducible protein